MNNSKNILKNSFDSLKDFYSKQEEKILSNPRKQFSFFILVFVFFYLFFSLAITPIANQAKEFNGVVATSLLSVQGISVSEQGYYETVDNEIVYSFLVGEKGLEKQIIISWLCTGISEIIILVGAIIATLGIAWKKKLIGIVIGIIAGILFNIARIWITINIILTQEAPIIEFSHDFLFRAILFVYIISVYVIWFYYSNTKK